MTKDRKDAYAQQEKALLMSVSRTITIAASKSISTPS